MGLNSLISGISGINTSEKTLDIIGNNLANVNTPGYKSQRSLFSDTFYSSFSQSLGGAPVQIGNGARLASVSVNQTQGTLEPTDGPLDFGIQGNGFFVVSNQGSRAYTRSGSFSVDNNNYLIDNASGQKVQRFGSIGEGNNGDPVFQNAGDSGIRIPYGLLFPASPTENVTLRGNLSPDLAVGETTPSSFQVIDPQGVSHQVDLAFKKTGAREWQVTASLQSGEGTIVSGGTSTMTFNDQGLIDSGSSTQLTVHFNGFSQNQTVKVQFGDSGLTGGFTQLGTTSTIGVFKQDGFPPGSLSTVQVTKEGVIKGVFSNGLQKDLAQLAIATFPNPSGLDRIGQNLLVDSGSSGDATISTPGSSGAGQVVQGTLEASNVDTSGEFSRLIVAQRTYQINARVISVSDQILQELTNITR